jgi:hypothetical protein
MGQTRLVSLKSYISKPHQLLMLLVFKVTCVTFISQQWSKKWRICKKTWKTYKTIGIQKDAFPKNGKTPTKHFYPFRFIFTFRDGESRVKFIFKDWSKYLLKAWLFICPRILNDINTLNELRHGQRPRSQLSLMLKPFSKILKGPMPWEHFLHQMRELPTLDPQLKVNKTFSMILNVRINRITYRSCFKFLLHPLNFVGCNFKKNKIS